MALESSESEEEPAADEAPVALAPAAPQRLLSDLCVDSEGEGEEERADEAPVAPTPAFAPQPPEQARNAAPRAPARRGQHTL